MCTIFSDGWTTDDLVFLWKEGDPVQVVKNLHLPRFTLEKYRTDYCNSKTNTGKSFELTLLQLGEKKNDNHFDIMEKVLRESWFDIK